MMQVGYVCAVPLRVGAVDIHTGLFRADWSISTHYMEEVCFHRNTEKGKTCTLGREPLVPWNRQASFTADI